MNDTNINHNNFNRQLLKLSIPIIIQNLLSAAVSFLRCCHAQLRGTVFYFRSVTGCQLFQCTLYGILAEWAPGFPSVCPVFWQKGSESHTYYRGNCPAFFPGNFSAGGPDCLYHAGQNDADFHLRP